MANPRFVIKAVISGQRLNINIPLTVAGTLNYIGVEAKCTSEWDDCTVTCYIINAEGNLLRMALTYDKERDIYFFPTSELLTLGAGEWSIYFVGVQVNNGEISYRITTESRNFTIAYNILYSDVPPEQIPLYEQAIAIADDAKKTADDLYQMYLDGYLKGDKGDTGDPARIGFVQASVGTSTTNPRCTVTTTENPEGTYNMQFAFNGIHGRKGDKGDKGDTGTIIDDYVLVQDTEPTSPTNKMWLKRVPGGDPLFIPTVEEFNALNDKVEAIVKSNNLFDKDASGIQPNRYIKSTGSASSSTTGSISDYITVIPGSTLSISPVVTNENWYYNEYANTAGKTRRETKPLYNIDTLYIPDDVYFIKITFVTDSIDDVYITYKDTNTITVENAHELNSINKDIQNHYASTEYIDLWQQGTLDDGGATQGNSTRIVSGSLYAFDGLIVPEPGYEIMAGVYDKNSVYQGIFNGTDTYGDTPVYYDTFLPVYMIPDNYQIRIVMRTKNSDAITPAEQWDKAYIVKYHLNQFLRMPIKQKSQNINGKGHCAFPGMCYFAGKMLISYRFSKSHYPPTGSSDWGGAQIDSVTNGMVVKHELTLTSKSLNDWMDDRPEDYPPSAPRIEGELGNVYMGVSNDGDYLVLSSWTTIWVGSSRKFENILICLDRNLTIQGVQVIKPPEVGLQHKFWGFPLFTPTNHLIIAGYTLVGDTTDNYDVSIWRSEQAFTNNVYGLTMQLAGVITDNQYAGETCLGYIGNKLAAIIRRQGAGTTAGNSTFLKLSSDLEGETNFTGNEFSAGMIIHCPTLLPHSSGNKLFFVGAKRNGANNRETVIGYYEINGDNAEIKEVRGIDDINYNFGGYAGFVSDGDEKFWLVYYIEDTSTSLSTGHTGLFLKYVNAREVLSTLN